MSAIPSYIPPVIPTQTFTSLRDVPKFCIEMARVLSKQPFYNGCVYITSKIKVVSFESFDDTRVSDIFNTNATRLFGENFPNISQFSNGAISNVGPNLQHGLILWIDYCFDSPVTFEKLLEAYNNVISILCNNWEKASKLEDYPEIFNRQYGDEFYQFVKKDNLLLEEDTLIRFMAMKLSLSEDVKADNHWKIANKTSCGNTILWVRKTKVAEVVSKFGFKLEY